jgi:hypothetical protein
MSLIQLQSNGSQSQRCVASQLGFTLPVVLNANNARGTENESAEKLAVYG